MSRSRVIVVRSGKVRSASGGLDRTVLEKMLSRGLELLAGRPGRAEAVLSLFRAEERVGIKINTISGRAAGTRPEVSDCLAECLSGAGLIPGNIVIWDRTNRELRDAGYKLNAEKSGTKVFGTDTDGVGYDRELLIHRNIGSLVSRIQKDRIDASISLAVLKDHGLAGVTAGMKNYFGAIHNPNKYHDSGCDPYVAELFDSPPIRSKHRLSILDCLTVQFHRGPAFHPRWSNEYNGFVLSLDPVAADRMGWKIIEGLRSADGLPSLREEGREPAYLLTAERMGLGTAADDKMDVIEETV